MKKVISFSVLFLFLLTSNLRAQWVQTSGPGLGSVKSLLIVGTNIFAGTGRIGGPHYGLFLSTNNGQNWTQTSLNNHDVIALALSGTNILAGTDTIGVQCSTNNGQNWIQTSLNNISVHSFSSTASNIFAGGYGVSISTNNGMNWTYAGLGGIITSLLCSGHNLFAGNGILYGCVYLTTNNGQNWTQTSLNNQMVFSLAGSDTNIFAGTLYGIYRTTNNGQNWIQTFSYNHGMYALAVSGTNVFAGTSEDGVYISTNNGINWVQKNEGLGSLDIQAFALNNNNIFAGAWDGYVYRRPLYELVGIKKISNDIPEHFSLAQNYPNPFNPTAKIKFDIPNINPPLAKGGQGGLTSLKIYNILGNEIATLVNEHLQPGSYQVEWDGIKFSSGVYFYKLVSDEYTETKKMILMK